MATPSIDVIFHTLIKNLDNFDSQNLLLKREVVSLQISDSCNYV